MILSASEGWLVGGKCVRRLTADSRQLTVGEEKNGELGVPEGIEITK
jgi:hypothetical protein